MPLESRIPPSFVMIQADFALVVLEAAFDAPTREGRQKDRPTDVSGGALLTKNFISEGSSTLRATTKCHGPVGRPSGP